MSRKVQVDLGLGEKGLSETIKVRMKSIDSVKSKERLRALKNIYADWFLKSGN